MQINATNFVRRLLELQKDLDKGMSQIVSDIALEMHHDIVSTAAVTFSPSWQSAVTMFGKHYFQEPYSSERKDGRTNGLLETIQKETLTLTKINGVTSIGLGDIGLLDEEAPYWKIFLGYGIYERGLGERAGGSETHTFIPYTTSNGQIIQNAGFMAPIKDEAGHPGVMPVFMFEDTLLHYMPIIENRIKGVIKTSIKRF